MGIVGVGIGLDTEGGWVGIVGLDWTLRVGGWGLLVLVWIRY